MKNQLTKHRDLIRQFVSFLGVGGVATLFHYAIYIGLVELAGIRPYIATGIGYFLSTFLNYYLNYLYTFRSQKRHREAIVKFFTIAGIGLFLNSSIVKIATESFGLNYLLAQVGATGLVTIWNFAGNRLWTFREKKQLT